MMAASFVSDVAAIVWAYMLTRVSWPASGVES